MTHTPSCRCATCHPDGRAALLALARGDYDAYRRHLARYRSARGLRAAASGSPGELRTGIHYVEDTMTEDCSPPNSYDAALQRLRDAAATPQSRFAAQHAEARRRELAAEPQTTPLKPTRLTARELASYEAPRPYDAGIKALRAQEAKR